MSDDATRRAMFDEIGAEVEITHPFAKQERPGRETGSPTEGWFVSEERAQFLSLGEQHLRQHTRQVMDDLLPADRRHLTVYDPACSTGVFLAEFAERCPCPVTTIGQDLSAGMVECAAKVLDEVHLGDALQPAVAEASVDLLFVRFLNSEVVTTDQAQATLPRLAATLRRGGRMVVVGHTPTLIGTVDLRSVGLEVESSSARAGDVVFQYYVGRRIAG